MASEYQINVHGCYIKNKNINDLSLVMNHIPPQSKLYCCV